MICSPSYRAGASSTPIRPTGSQKTSMTAVKASKRRAIPGTDPGRVRDYRVRAAPLKLELRLADDSPPAIAAITAAEWLIGVERADTPERRARREEFVHNIFARVPV